MAPGATATGLRKRGKGTDVVAIYSHAGVFLGPGVCVLRNVGAAQYRACGGVGFAVAAVEHHAQGVNAAGGGPVEPVARPVVGGGTAQVGVGARGGDRSGSRPENPSIVVAACGSAGRAGGVGVTQARVEQPQVDDVWVKADVEPAVAVDVGGVVVGFVEQGVVACHGEHHQRRRALGHGQRRGGFGVGAQRPRAARGGHGAQQQAGASGSQSKQHSAASQPRPRRSGPVQGGQRSGKWWHGAAPHSAM